MAELTQPFTTERRSDVRLMLGGLSGARLAVPGLAALAGALYLVNLTVSGWANTYYALAAQAASQSWTALFFGSLDAANFVTLDKPPLAILPMAISVKLLGLSSFAILLPQALLGVATVVVLYLAVRRSFGGPAAAIAGLVTALTPAAVLIFRYDNPDALLTFLLVAAAWALGRGLERGRLRWAILAAALVGLAFLTKYLQAYLVLPVFALAWLVCAPVSLRRRILGLLASGLAVLVASGWWVAIVELIPAAARPYIGGSTTNSVLELILGYDGLGRIFGNSPGSGLASAVDGLAGAGGPTFSGTPGLLRLFNDQFGGQVAWLLLPALLALAVGAVVLRRAGRSDRRVAGYVLWGGWLAVHGLVFSLMSGIIHSYYAVAMVPAIGALVGAGASELWSRRRASPLAGAVLGVGVGAAGVTALVLLDRTPAYLPGLGWAILAVSAAAGLILAIPDGQLDRRISRAAAITALMVALAGPAAYAGATIVTAHAGGDPAAGPGGDGFAGGAEGGSDAALVSYLLDRQGSARWIVAVGGSQAAASIQLAAGEPVMAMGGFTGGDPTPTLEQLRGYVSSGELRYILLGRGLGGPPGFGTGPAFRGRDAGTSGISAWVTSTCRLVDVAGSASSGLYDCAPA
jgi:4-amino-4-deoxy-L-arabinose transferase-like glycosyltransferase